ncbi:MAG: hypothetical protein BWY66_00562 [bacterium ADurb.Bin374]|nr:MAG: hypothetical protein BWY66_00562 [bacterium ADurb.Bin374]
MNEMENFIDFLASKGVKSFHIEMQTCELSETQERNIERALRASEEKPCPVQAALAKHDIPVHRGEEPVPVVALPPAVEKALPAKVVKPDETPVKALVEERAAEEEKRADAAREKLVEKVIAPIVEKAVVTATQKQAKESAPELSAAKANASVKADTETTGAIAAENIDPKKLYDHFCAKITKDDGTFTVEERTGLIGRMGLDDLLRINNDFSLGLDTDKPVEDVREDVKNCFL